jgi:CubicO group peptidase (beta-lactamase class C family)
MKKMLIVLVTAIFGGSPLFADRNPEIDALIKNFMDEWDIPGASYAIAQKGTMVYNNALGYADRTQGLEARPDDVYRIASVSKPVTSIAIMNLVEKGKLSLSDRVFGFNALLQDPYYLNVIADPRIYAITVQNLLEHTAGWNRSLPTDGYSHSDAPFFPLHVTMMEGAVNPVGDSTLIRFSLRRGLQFSPGTAHAYSNLGYLILGKVIEQVAGVSYGQFVDSCILQPLAISDMKLGKNLSKDKFEKEVIYHSTKRNRSVYGTGEIVPEPYGGFNLEAMNAHGGWVTSAPSLIKLLSAANGYESTAAILSPESVRQMATPSAVNARYGLGWSVARNGSVFHTGSLEGSASFVCYTPDGYAWAFLLNSRSNSTPEFWRAFDKLPWKCVEILKRSQKEEPLDMFSDLDNPGTKQTIW